MLVSSLMQNAWDLSKRPTNQLTILAQQREQENDHDGDDDTTNDNIIDEDDDEISRTMASHNFDEDQHDDHQSHLIHQQSRVKSVNRSATMLRRQSEQTITIARGNTTSQFGQALSSSQLQPQQVDNKSSSGNNQRTDRRARKKDQNRRAALNYRRKKMEERNRVREEEMRLVYARVCLIGHADELESNIKYLLETQCQKLIDKKGSLKGLLCPLCPQSCDNVVIMRRHLATWHQQWIECTLLNNSEQSNNNDTDKNNNISTDPQQQNNPSLFDHNQLLHQQQRYHYKTTELRLTD